MTKMTTSEVYRLETLYPACPTVRNASLCACACCVYMVFVCRYRTFAITLRVGYTGAHVSLSSERCRTQNSEMALSVVARVS